MRTYNSLTNQHTCQLYTLVSRWWHCWSVMNNLWCFYAVRNKWFYFWWRFWSVHELECMRAWARAHVRVSLTQFHQCLQVNAAFTCSSKRFTRPVTVFRFLYFRVSSVTAWHKFLVIEAEQIEQWVSNMWWHFVFMVKPRYGSICRPADN